VAVPSARQRDRLAVVGIVERGRELELAACQVDQIIGRAVAEPADRGATFGVVLDRVAGMEAGAFAEVEHAYGAARGEGDVAREEA
jgi:hypothetical protein